MIDLTSSPEKLKYSILKEAMQGKLTQQLPEDGNVIDLLKQIDDEKEQLIANKKINNSNKLPDIKSEEIPFHIPNTWKWTRLDNIGVWKSGSTPKRNHQEYYNGEIPWLKTGDLNDNYVTTTSEKITQIGLDNSNLKLNPVGSVLIAMYGATIGKLGILNIESATNQACCACEPSKFINNKFLFYYLMSQKQQLISLGSGGAQPNISRKKIINYLIPLPPFKEQNRIVNKLDSTLPKVKEFSILVNKLQNLRNKFPDRLKSSILQEAMQGKLTNQLPTDGNAINLVEEIKNEKKQLIKDKKIKRPQKLLDVSDDELPFDIPNNWQWVRLGNIANLVIGKTPSRHNQDYWNGDIPWVSVRDMNNDTLYKTKEGITKKAESDKFKNNIIPKGTMLMSFKLSIGKVCILGMPAYHNEAIVSFNFFKYSDELKAFLFPTIHFLTKFAHSKNAIQGKTLNKTSLNNMLIPLPPLEEQKRIVNKLNHLFKALNLD